jgi:hypothetical protein
MLSLIEAFSQTAHFLQSQQLLSASTALIAGLALSSWLTLKKGRRRPRKPV